MFQNIGFTELLLIAVVALVLFGPKKLPEIGRMLGKTLRDFKQAANELMNEEPKAPIASKTPVVPDPITPVAAARVVATDEDSIATLTSSQQSSKDAEAAAEPTSSPAVKPAVAFVTNKSSEVVRVSVRRLKLRKQSLRHSHYLAHKQQAMCCPPLLQRLRPLPRRHLSSQATQAILGGYRISLLLCRLASGSAVQVVCTRLGR